MKGRKYSTKNAGCVVAAAAAAAKREEEDGGGLGCEGVRAHARSCQKEEVAEDGERASSLTPQLSLRRERERGHSSLSSPYPYVRESTVLVVEARRAEGRIPERKKEEERE